MRQSLLVLILTVLLLPAAGALGAPQPGSAGSGAAWPQWRGPNRDAVSTETGLVDRWGDGGPVVLWRVKAGEGFSGVSVAGDRIFTMWDDGDDQVLVGLDAATGEPRWRRILGPSFKNHYGNGPRSTPAVDDGRVYAVGTNGVLLAARASDGRTEWKKDLVQELGARLPSYGYASSPLVVGDRLFVEAGGDKAAYVALDKKSGRVLWTAADDRPAYSSPISIRIDGVSQIVFWSAHGLHAVAASDGATLWHHRWETFCPVSGDPLNTGTPVFLPPDRVFLSSGSGAALIRIVRDGEAFKVESLWESEQLRSDVNTALLLDDHLYGFDRGTLKSLDVGTGQVDWAARGYRRGSLIAADGKLIVLAEDGRLGILDADPHAYTERSLAPVLRGQSWTAPSLAGGRLFLRNHEELVCIDMKRREPHG